MLDLRERRWIRAIHGTKVWCRATAIHGERCQPDPLRDELVAVASHSKNETPLVECLREPESHDRKNDSVRSAGM